MQLLALLLLWSGLVYTTPTNTTHMNQKDLHDRMMNLYAHYQQLVRLYQQQGRTTKDLSEEEHHMLRGLKHALQLYDTHQKEVGGPPDSEEEIGDQEFALALETWANNLKQAFKSNKQKYAQVTLASRTYATELADRVTKSLPINQLLLPEWQSIITGLPDSCTGQVLFDALLNNTGAAWQMVKDPSEILKHYHTRSTENPKKKNKGIYKQIGLQTLKASLPKPEYFEQALRASTPKKDPNLPENRTEAEAAQKEALKEMRQTWNYWLNHTTIPALGETDTSTEGKLIDIALLEKNRDRYLDSPNYAEAFWQAVSDAVLRKTRALNGTPAYEQVVTIAIRELGQLFNAHVTDEFLLQGIKSNEADLPSGLKRWLVNSIDQDDALYTQFKQICLDWSSSTKGLAGEAEAANNNRAFKVNRSKWTAQLRTLFQNSAQPLLEPLLTALPEKSVLDLPAIQAAWTQGLNAIQAEDFLEALWIEQFTKSTEGSLEGALTTFKTALPTLKTLGQTLLNARYHTSKPTQKPEPTLVDIRSTMQLAYVLHWKPRASLSEHAMRAAMAEADLPNAVDMTLNAGQVLIDGMNAFLPESIVPKIKDAKDYVRLPIEPDTINISLPWSVGQVKTDQGPLYYAKLWQESTSAIGLDTISPYTIQRVGWTQEEPVVDNNVVFQVVRFTLDVKDVTVSRNAAMVVGISVSSNPPTQTLTFELTVVSEYNTHGNEEVLVSIVGEEAPTTAICPLLDRVEGPTTKNINDFQRFKPVVD